MIDEELRELERASRAAPGDAAARERLENALRRLGRPPLIRDGAWSGQRCFIIGGGPSLRGFDWRQIVGERVIAINGAMLESSHRHSLAFGMGARLIECFGDVDLVLLKHYRERLAWLLPAEHHAEARTIGALPLLSSGTEWSESLASGRLAHGPGGGAGTPAVNLAWLLGARPVYLLGFEHRTDRADGRTSNWHRQYPESWERDERVYEPMRGDLERHAERLRGAVVDLSPGGTLEGFERSTVAKVLGDA